MDIYCSKCGKQIHEKAKFCPYCGEVVLINKDLPDDEAVNEAVEPKAEETPIQEAAPQPQYQQAPRVSDSLIEQYKREIEVCRKRKKTMVTLGIIVLAIFFVLAITFIVLVGIRSYNIAYEAAKAGEDAYAAVEDDLRIQSYTTLASLSGVGINGGIVLIVLGAVSNSVKIKNRERIIRENEKK